MNNTKPLSRAPASATCPRWRTSATTRSSQAKAQTHSLAPQHGRAAATCVATIGGNLYGRSSPRPPPGLRPKWGSSRETVDRQRLDLIEGSCSIRYDWSSTFWSSPATAQAERCRCPMRRRLRAAAGQRCSRDSVGVAGRKHAHPSRTAHSARAVAADCARTQPPTTHADRLTFNEVLASRHPRTRFSATGL